MGGPKKIVAKSTKTRKRASAGRDARVRARGGAGDGAAPDLDREGWQGNGTARPGYKTVKKTLRTSTFNP